jgi:WD40 repeat protein
MIPAAKANKEYSVFDSHYGLSRMVFVGDGDSLLSVQQDEGIVRLWNIGLDGANMLLHEYDKPQDTITSLAVSKNGSRFVTGTKTGVIKVFNINGTLLTNFERQHGTVNEIVFSPSGDSILTAFDNGSVVLWEVTSNKQLKEFKRSTNEVFSIAFSADGKNVLTASRDSATLWTINGNLASSISCSAFGHEPVVAFSPEGKRLVIGNNTWAKLYDYDLNRFFQLKELKVTSGYIVFNSIVSVNFSSDGKTIYTTDSGGNIKVWGVDGNYINTSNMYAASGYWEWKQTLKEFLRSNMVEPLTEVQKKEFGIK